MALNDTILNIGANAQAAAMTHLSIHTATPNATGSNESTAARVAAGWAGASTGDLTITNKNFTGGAAGGAAVAVGFWSAATAGTFYGYQTLTGDTTFNSAGEYSIISLVVNGNSA